MTDRVEERAAGDEKADSDHPESAPPDPFHPGGEEILQSCIDPPRHSGQARSFMSTLGVLAPSFMKNLGQG